MFDSKSSALIKDSANEVVDILQRRNQGQESQVTEDSMHRCRQELSGVKSPSLL